MLIQFLSRNLFCHRTTWCGIRLENGCLIFAIFNAIAVATFLGECLYFFTWLTVIQPILRKYEYIEGEDFVTNMFYGAGLTACAGMCFFFAILLCLGIIRKKPSYIRAYFIFGVVVEILGLFCTLVFIADDNIDQEQEIGGLVALTICGVYPFLLIMVRRTHRIMLKEADADDSYHKKSISHCNGLSD